MTDKEKLERLGEQVLKLEIFIKSMLLLMGEDKNTINIKECIDEIFLKVSLMIDTLKEEEEDE